VEPVASPSVIAPSHAGHAAAQRNSSGSSPAEQHKRGGEEQEREVFEL
jgi:hypothetical protein